jgi:hypothetical protein
LEDGQALRDKNRYQPGQMIPVLLQSVSGDQLQVSPLLAHSA